MFDAGIAQLVEHNLAKVGVASSSLVSRSKIFIKAVEFSSLNLIIKIAVMAGWQSGYAAACKAVNAGSIPTPASIHQIRLTPGVIVNSASIIIILF